MKTGAGGKVTLRRSSATEDGAEYSGEATSTDRAWTLEARVSKGGAVQIEHDPSLPDWLVRLARSLLRAAWRSSSGVSGLPRRISRWRDAPSSEDPN